MQIREDGNPETLMFACQPGTCKVKLWVVSQAGSIQNAQSPSTKKRNAKPKSAFL